MMSVNYEFRRLCYYVVVTVRSTKCRVKGEVRNFVPGRGLTKDCRTPDGAVMDCEAVVD